MFLNTTWIVNTSTTINHPLLDRPLQYFSIRFDTEPSSRPIIWFLTSSSQPTSPQSPANNHRGPSCPTRCNSSLQD